MGDRGNLGIIQPSDDVLFIYTHWTGSTLLNDLAQALAVAHPRWTETDYATRIIVSQIIGEQWDTTSGFGLSVNALGDTEQPPHPTPVVSFSRQVVSIFEPTWTPVATPVDVLTFHEYLVRYGPA
jgi:hypothetical protein